VVIQVVLAAGVCSDFFDPSYGLSTEKQIEMINFIWVEIICEQAEILNHSKSSKANNTN